MDACTQAIVEALLRNQQALNEQSVPNYSEFRRISVPLIRRIYPMMSDLRPKPTKSKVNWKKEGF